jgi:GNAT superfamily N-acetyltransferase
MLFSIHYISAAQAFPLRREVLLEGTSESCRFRGDDDEGTLHVAVSRGEQIVAVATVCLESLPGCTSDTAWRLRGVAVAPDARRFGFGRVLIKLCCEHARRRGGRLAWCTARESARGFYESLGFASSSAPFTLPSRGELLFYEMHYILPGVPAEDAE